MVEKYRRQPFVVIGTFLDHLFIIAEKENCLKRRKKWLRAVLSLLYYRIFIVITLPLIVPVSSFTSSSIKGSCSISGNVFTLKPMGGLSLCTLDYDTSSRNYMVVFRITCNACANFYPSFWGSEPFKRV